MLFMLLILNVLATKNSISGSSGINDFVLPRLLDSQLFKAFSSHADMIVNSLVKTTTS